MDRHCFLTFFFALGFCYSSVLSCGELPDHNSLSRQGIENNKANTPTRIRINEVYNDSYYDATGIDTELVIDGKMFLFEIGAIRFLSEGQPVDLELFGKRWKGIVDTKKTVGQFGHTYMNVNLGDDAHSMSIYFGSSITRGTINTRDDSYVFQQNTEVGFILRVH